MDRDNINALLLAYRCLNNRNYSIVVEDTEHTHNINMHTFDCFATSYEEAYGKMCLQRPEFKNRKVISYNTI
jgi:hypothetical protein